MEKKQHGWSSRVRIPITLALAAFGMTVGLACNTWFSWDVVFDRTAPGGPVLTGTATAPPDYAGWRGGDGAADVLLPDRNGSHETLWLFGDSLVSSGSGSSFSPSNSIAITDVPTSSPAGTPPTNSQRWWYARDSVGVVKDVTNGINGASKSFFQGNDTDSHFRTWPADGIVLSDGALYVFGFQMKDGVVPMDEYVFKVSNPTAQIGAWAPVRTRVAMANNASPFALPTLKLLWGEAIWVDQTTAYIFGISITGINFQDLGASTPTPFYLARATSQNILNYETWEFLKSNSLWQTGAPTALSQLKQLGNMANATEFSVDRVTMNDDHGVPRTRFVMVHGRPQQGDDIVVQVSTADNVTAWANFNPSQPGPNQWIGSITGSIDPSVKVGTGVPTCPAGKQYVRAVRGHLAHSAGTTLLVSYYPTSVKFSEDTVPPPLPNYRQYNSCVQLFATSFRFTNAVDLTKLKPWCTGTTGCWN